MLRGFGAPVTVLVLVLSASLGLLMALVLKRQNNLVRLYAEAVHLPGQVRAARGRAAQGEGPSSPRALAPLSPSPPPRLRRSCWHSRWAAWTG